MQLDLYLKISAQLRQLAHDLDHVYFDTKSLIPRALNSKETKETELILTHNKARLARYIAIRQHIFKNILIVLAEPNNDLPTEFRTLISNKMQQWHDNRQSYLDNLKSIPKSLIHRNPDTTKIISDLCSEINAEDSAGLQDLGLTIGSILINHHPDYFQKQASRYHPGKIFENRAFLLAIMQYQGQNTSNLELANIYRYFVWYYTKILPKKVEILSARDVLPQAAFTGLAADAIILHFNKKVEVFFILKGTEFHRDTTMHTLNPLKSWNKALVEAYRDWRYNVQAILLGEDTEFSQIDVAHQFIELVKTKLPQDTQFYGLGHSLGGHLVQALQMVYRPFTEGYTLNAAPVQLRQIYKLAPELFSIETWDKLLMTTISGGAQPKDEDRPFLEKTLGYSQFKITNEGFAQDFVQVFYHMHFNVYIGQFKKITHPELNYQFIPAITDYLTSEEINFAAFTMGEFFRQTDETDPNQSLRSQIIQFMRKWGKPPHLTPKKRQQFTKDYNRYLVTCGILKPKVPATPAHLPHVMTKHLSSGKIAIARRLQTETCELLIYFHVISGARFLLHQVYK